MTRWRNLPPPPPSPPKPSLHLSLRVPRLCAPHLSRLVILGLLRRLAELVRALGNVVVEVTAVVGGQLVRLLQGAIQN